MTEKTEVKPARRGARLLDAGMAALAALSLAFLIFAMPAEIFRQVAGTIGIGSRPILMVAAAASTFALIFGFLRALERLPRTSVRAPIEIPAEPPRLRRADAHPDAPARVPVFARHELGDPLPIEQPQPQEAEAVEPPAEVAIEALDARPEEDILELDQPVTGLLASGFDLSDGEPVEREPAIEAPEQPLPSFIAEELAAQPAADRVMAESLSAPPPAEDEPPADAEPLSARDPIQQAPAPVELSAPAHTQEEAAEVELRSAPIHPEAQAGPAEEQDALSAEAVPAIAEPEHVPEHPPAAPTVEAADEERALEPAPANEAVDEETIEPTPASETAGASETTEGPQIIEAKPSVVVAENKPLPAPEQAPEPIEQLSARLPELPQPRDETISDLMGRLETGLGRRDRARWLGQSDDEPVEAPADERLKSAIGMLRKMAGRR